ncbi:MAG: uncharacterized protein QOK29_255 [Rhodospirillaceae bacterium]|nr:uncharacterized protein [Rhodospirillaceae bacterium]
MSIVGSLQAIWRYPVSSLAGEALSEAPIDLDGVRGDRRWGIADAETGEAAAPERKRRWRQAMEIEARMAGAGVEIRLPDGDWLNGNSPAGREALVRHFGFPAELRRHPAPDLAAGSPTVKPRYKRSHIHLLSAASLATLQALLPGSRLHPRRFRPSLLVDLAEPSSPFPETEWDVGREFYIGAVRLKVTEPCRRCAVTVLGQGDLSQDPAVLAAITAHNQTNLGVLCSVVTPGGVSLGDPLRLA